MTYDEFAIINITAAGSRRFVDEGEIRLFCNDTEPGWASSSFGRATPVGLQLPSVADQCQRFCQNARFQPKTYDCPERAKTWQVGKVTLFLVTQPIY